MNRTRIEWTDFTWNPVVGCTGSCPYCYARKMAHRFHLGQSDFLPEWSERNFNRPFPRKPSRIFVNSMSDLADWELDWYKRVYAQMFTHPQHSFLFLSKRPWDCEWTALPNTWLGYSVTRQVDFERLLRNGGNRFVSFLSIEPLLDRVDEPTLWAPKWIIVGSETGNRRERVVPKLAWLVSIRDFARARGIPLFFKESLRRLWPVELPQEYPKEIYYENSK